MHTGVARFEAVFSILARLYFRANCAHARGEPIATQSRRASTSPHMSESAQRELWSAPGCKAIRSILLSTFSALARHRRCHVQPCVVFLAVMRETMANNQLDLDIVCLEYVIMIIINILSAKKFVIRCAFIFSWQLIWIVKLRHWVKSILCIGR